MIGILLAAHLAWAAVVLAFMIVVAGWISRKRGVAIPGVFRSSVVSIGFGAGLVVVMMTLAGAIEATMRDLVVIGSMIIANAIDESVLNAIESWNDCRVDQRRPTGPFSTDPRFDKPLVQ